MTPCRALLAAVMTVAVLACRDVRSNDDSKFAGNSALVVSRAESLLALGEALHGEEEFDSARKVLDVALMQARAAGDARTAALALTRLGMAAWRLGDVTAARASQDSALALKTRLGMSDELSRSYNALGLVALSENRNREAAALFEKAIATAHAVGDHAGVGRATGNAALAYGYLGDLVRAREGHRAMRAAGQALEDARLEGNGLANEAMLDIAEGDPHTAIARLDTARTLYRKIAYLLGEQNAVGQLATAFEAIGEYGRAFSLLDTALHLSRSGELAEQEVEVLRLLGGMHARIGDHRRAVRYYGQAEQVAERSGVDGDRGSVHRGAAEAHLLLRNLPAARMHAARALALHEEGEEPYDQLDDVLLLVRIEHDGGDTTSARELLARAQDLAHTVATRGALTSVVLARARHEERRGDARGVLRSIAGLDPVSRELDLEARGLAASLASHAYARLGLLDSAAIAGRDAVHALERTRGTLALEPMRSTYTSERAAVYGDLVITLLRLGRTEEAFEVADRARSRGLLEHLGAARPSASGESVPRELVEADALLRRIDALVEALRRSEPSRLRSRAVPSADETAHADLTAARTEYEALLVRASARDARASSVVGASGSSLGAIAASLRPEEALIEYFVMPGKLVTFVVRSSGVRAIESEVDEVAIAERVRLLRDVWGRPRRDWHVGLPAAHMLHGALISPALTRGLLNGTRRLIIVPHGSLAQVPFAALRDARSGLFLAQQTAIVYAPSAATVATLRERAERTGTVRGAWAFAPLTKELPATASEVKELAHNMEGVTSFTGRRASEQALRMALESGAMVHVATHGVLNRRHPMFSRIELSRPKKTTPADDGRFEVRELLGLRVRSPLVFLSGCETGAAEGWLPEPVRGSADLTMSQAFLSAGARNVVSTLWRIDDMGASVFASHFYRSVRVGSTAEAVARAQRQMLRDARYASPYYWAGYVLSGEGGTVDGSARNARASVR